jgi:hypothetical protein
MDVDRATRSSSAFSAFDNTIDTGVMFVPTWTSLAPHPITAGIHVNFLTLRADHLLAGSCTQLLVPLHQRHDQPP